MQTLSITDSKMIRPNLAKVVVAWTGKFTKEQMFAKLTEKLQYLAQPVEHSFRTIREGAAVGFVRASKEVRVVESTKQLRAGYRVLSSNILMDNTDRTLWEVKDGAGGKFLARHGNDDLSELVEATTYHGRPDVPKVHHLAIASAARNELVAYCNSRGEMDYGFVVRTNPDKCQVVARSTNTLDVVNNEQISSIHQVSVKASTHKEILSKMTPADRANAAEYWRTLFSYAPEYAEQLVEYVNNDAVV